MRHGPDDIARGGVPEPIDSGGSTFFFRAV
jgi:hypothetical protein